MANTRNLLAANRPKITEVETELKTIDENKKKKNRHLPII
jgi:hypothetical protein